ncbi:hypothetical protein ES708_13505 [subsurface metagenome]
MVNIVPLALLYHLFADIDFHLNVSPVYAAGNGSVGEFKCF